jgi:ribokinase
LYVGLKSDDGSLGRLAKTLDDRLELAGWPPEGRLFHPHLTLARISPDLKPAQVEGLPPGEALLCQLEVPVPTVVHAAVHTAGFVALNLAPAIDVPVALLEHADLLVVNDTEALHYGEALHRGGGLVAVTHGARGATLLRGGREVAQARPPRIEPVDTTGAGDSFVAALLVALVEHRPLDAALAFACAAGAAAATTAGAQPSLPTRAVVEQLLREGATQR